MERRVNPPPPRHNAGVSSNPTPTAPPLPRPHVRRLREVVRSAGWPWLDAVEVDLLAAGLLERVAQTGADGRLAEAVRVTDAGLAALSVGLQRNRAAYDAHEALVHCVARQMQHAGRVVYTGLSLRVRVEDAAAQPEAAPPKPRWVVAKPDVYSIRNTSVAGYLAPTVHEVKVRRADLLGELRATPRTAAKRSAYLGMSSECWYVLGRDARGREIGDASEIGDVFGVMVATVSGGGSPRLQVVRPAPRRALPHPTGLPFGMWLALARAVPHTADETPAQLALQTLSSSQSGHQPTSIGP
jgi:hypothetical protein